MGGVRRRCRRGGVGGRQAGRRLMQEAGGGEVGGARARAPRLRGCVAVWLCGMSVSCELPTHPAPSGATPPPRPPCVGSDPTQVQLLCDVARPLLPASSPELEVSSVDGYQGREKEVRSAGEGEGVRVVSCVGACVGACESGGGEGAQNLPAPARGQVGLPSGLEHRSTPRRGGWGGVPAAYRPLLPSPPSPTFRLMAHLHLHLPPSPLPPTAPLGHTHPPPRFA